MALDPSNTAAERDGVSKSLVDSGCRYAVCSGHESSKWDDSIDRAFLETDPDLNPPDERFVMTSFHEDESLNDVAEFFVRLTSFDGFKPAAFVLVALGNGSAIDETRARVAELLEMQR